MVSGFVLGCCALFIAGYELRVLSCEFWSSGIQGIKLLGFGI